MTTHAARPTPTDTDTDPGTSAGGGPATSRWLLVLALAAVAVPFVALVVPLLLHDGPYANYGDVATMELAVERATEIDQTVGAYSRYRWNHPGPLVFYLLAVPYQLLGGRGLALAVGSIAINAAASTWIVALLGRRAGARAALAAAAAVGTLHLVLSMQVLADAWTPFLITVPTALFLLLCADACTTGGRWAPAAAVAVGSFLVQTHVAMAAPVTAALVLASAVWVWTRWRRAGSLLRAGPDLVPLLLAAATFLVLWAPPLWQELRARPGNLTALVRFFLLDGASGERGHSPGDAAGALAAGMVGTRPHFRPDLGVDGGNVALLAVVLVAIAVVTALAWRRRRWTAVALSATSLLVAGVTFATLLRVEGLLHGYLVVWTAAIPVGGLLAAVLAVAPRPDPAGHLAPVDRTRADAPAGVPRRSRVVGGPVVTALLVAAVVVVAVSATAHAIAADPERSDPRVLAARAAVAPLLGPADDDVLVCIRAHQPGPWGVAVGVVADLRSRGIDARVQDHWLFAFGDQLAAEGDERLLLELDTTLGPPRPLAVGEAHASAVTEQLRASVFRPAGDATIDEAACPPPM